MQDQGDWRQWTALNRQLLKQWQTLLAADPSLTAAPEIDTNSLEHKTTQLFAQHSNDIMAVFATGGGCVFLTPNWKKLTGLPADQAMGNKFYGLVDEEHRKAFVTTLQQALHEDELAQFSLYPLSFRLRVKDEEPHWYSLSVVDVQPTENGQHQLFCVLKDIHATVQAGKLSRQAQQDIYMSQETRNEFFNSMSHEFRTPLNAILGFTQIMENGMFGNIENKQYLDYLGHIRESGHDLLKQIDEVLGKAHVSSRQPSHRREICELHTLCLEVISLHQAEAASGNVVIHLEVPSDCFFVKAIRKQLQHCISHILANAIRHSREGNEIAIEAGIDGSGELCLSVTDNGTGIPSRKLPAVLALLQNSKNWPGQQKTLTPSMGIGLVLARQIAELHGGYITLESKENVGTRVDLHLPAHALATAPLEDTAATG